MLTCHCHPDAKGRRAVSCSCAISYLLIIQVQHILIQFLTVLTIAPAKSTQNLKTPQKLVSNNKI